MHVHGPPPEYFACLLAWRRSWRLAPRAPAAGPCRRWRITRAEKKRCMPRPLTLTENLLALLTCCVPIPSKSRGAVLVCELPSGDVARSGLLVGQRWARLARSVPGAMRSARSRTSAHTVHRSARGRCAAPGKPQGNTRAHQCHYPSQEKVCQPQ